MAWSPDNTRLAVVPLDSTVAVHTLDHRAGPTYLRLASASELAWHNDRIAVAGSGTVTVLRLVIRED
jgi:hypothetical protein